MSIQTFDRTSAAALITQVTDVVQQQIGAAAGLAVRRLRGTYDSGTVHVTLELSVLQGPDGKAAAEKTFAQRCRLYGFQPTDYGRTFTTQSASYTLTGFAPTRRKNPVVAKRSDGREYFFPVYIVAALLKTTP